VPGAVHVHTTYSDGAGSVPEVAAVARRVGLEFVIISDHQRLEALRDGWEGYHDGRLVLIGAELRSRGGYVLALDLPPSFEHRKGTAEETLAAVRAAGGLPFMALTGDPCLGWTEWAQRDAAGMEVLNLHSLGRSRANLALLACFTTLQLLRMPARAVSLLISRPTRELAVWDALLASRRTAGIASVDAHSRLKLGPFVFSTPTYEQSFRLL